MSFTETLELVAGRLRALGVPVAADIRDLNPPAALLTLDAVLAPTRLCGTGSLRILVDLVARDVGDRPALDQLEALHTTALEALGSWPTQDETTFTRRITASEPSGLPALRLTLEVPTITTTRETS